jgi:hypothetical protein
MDALEGDRDGVVGAPVAELTAVVGHQTYKTVLLCNVPSDYVPALPGTRVAFIAPLCPHGAVGAAGIAVSLVAARGTGPGWSSAAGETETCGRVALRRRQAAAGKCTCPGVQTSLR